MSKTTNIMICGVGGQGSLLASRKKNRAKRTLWNVNCAFTLI